MPQTSIRSRYRKTGRTRKFYKKTRSTSGLAKQVARLTRRVNKSQIHNVNLFQNGNLQLTSNYAVLPLSNWGSLTPCFGYTTTDYNNANEAFLKSITMQFRLNSANEEDNISYSMFLVSISKNGSNIYDQATGTLSALTQPLHYLSTASMGMLNKKYFKIHRTKFGNLGNWSTPLQQSSAGGKSLTTLDQFYWKIKPMKTIKNPAGNFASLACSQDPATQYYIIVLNDNSTADLESPILEYNIIYSLNIDG